MDILPLDSQNPAHAMKENEHRDHISLSYMINNPVFTKAEYVLYFKSNNNPLWENETKKTIKLLPHSPTNR